MAEHKKYERSNTWESLEFKALGEAIGKKHQEMLEMAGAGGEKLKSLSKEEVEDFQTRNAELTDMREKFKGLREVDEGFKKQVEAHKSFSTPNRKVPFPGNGDAPDDQLEEQYKSLGERFTESAAYKAMHESGNVNTSVKALEADIQGVTIKSLQDSIKTTMARTAGWEPYPTLSPRPPVMSAQIPPVVADLIPQDNTDQPSILWYEETTYTNNAGVVAEGIGKAEAALATTRRSQIVEKIAVTLPVTDEQLMDVPQIRGYIDGRLVNMVKQAEQVQILRGTGVSPQLQGFHTKAQIGSLARGANEDNADAFLRAITQVNSIAGYANVTGVVMNPLQWLAIRLVRTTTGDYIWGHPSLIGPATLWGLPVISTNAETDGLGLVGDFQMYSHISRRMGMRIDVGYINTDFKDNIQRIRVEERLSLEIYRAAAFCEVTNLNKAA